MIVDLPKHYVRPPLEKFLRTPLTRTLFIEKLEMLTFLDLVLAHFLKMYGLQNVSEIVTFQVIDINV